MTAVVQLLLERHRQQCHTGSDALSPAAEDATSKAVSAKVHTYRTSQREKSELDGKGCTTAVSCNKPFSLGPNKAEPHVNARDAVCARPAIVPPCELKLTETLSQNKPPVRSNQDIIRLAHALTASHANPQLEGVGAADMVAFSMRKPAVPRASRQSVKSQSNTPIYQSSGDKDLTPLTTMSAFPPRRRPAWAQLSNAAPAEQEQALLDWVTAVEEPSLDSVYEQNFQKNLDAYEPGVIAS